MRGSVGGHNHRHHHCPASSRQSNSSASIPVSDFLFGTKWTALFKDGEFGVIPLVAGTFYIAALAMVIAIPLGLMSAIFLSEYASPRLRSVLKPGLELLAGIPTIVYGYFALTFITSERAEVDLASDRSVQRPGRSNRGRCDGAADDRVAFGGRAAGGTAVACARRPMGSARRSSKSRRES